MTASTARRIALMRHLKDWHTETAHESSLQRKHQNPNRQKLLEMLSADPRTGISELIAILESRVNQKYSWLAVILLPELAGENPVRPSSIGKIKKIRQDWLDWHTRKKLQLQR